MARLKLVDTNQFGAITALLEQEAFMQSISVMAFSYDRKAQQLTEEASSLTGQLDIAALLRGERFEVVGNTETKMYTLVGPVREPAVSEIGDIVAWEFKPVNKNGSAQPGPWIVISND